MLTVTADGVVLDPPDLQERRVKVWIADGDLTGFSVWLRPAGAPAIWDSLERLGIGDRVTICGRMKFEPLVRTQTIHVFHILALLPHE